MPHLDETAVRTWTHFPDVQADSEFELARGHLFIHVNHCEDCGMNPPRMCSQGVKHLRHLLTVTPMQIPRIGTSPAK